MSTLLIVNPYSRNGDADLDEVVAALSELGPVDVMKLGGEEEVPERIAKLGAGLERVVVAGGDGTLSSVLSDIVATGLPLGVLPLGTANDFAHSLGLSSDPVEAAKTICDNKTHGVDVGVVNGHYFLNAVGVGLGPELTKQLDRDTKKRLGVIAYLESLIQVFYKRRRYRATLRIDGREHRLPFVQITIGNSRHYGGGMTVCEDARIDDGVLHVLCVRPLTPLQLFLRGTRLKFGAVKDDEKLFYATGKRVELDVRRQCDVTADGELLSKTPIRCHTIKNAMQVYVSREQAAVCDAENDQYGAESEQSDEGSQNSLVA